MPIGCFRSLTLELGREEAMLEDSEGYVPEFVEESRHLTPSPDMGMVPAGWSPCGPDGQPTQHQPVDLTAHLKVHNELFPSRKQRKFIPDNKKDDNYWDRRRRNNEAAKRSREKRRLNDMVLESRVLELTKENTLLRAELNSLRDKVDCHASEQAYQQKVSSGGMQGPPARRSKLLTSLMPELLPEEPPALSPPPALNHNAVPVPCFDPLAMDISPTHNHHTSHSAQLVLTRALCVSPRPEMPSVFIQHSYTDLVDMNRPVNAFSLPANRNSPVDQESAGSTGSWSSEEGGSTGSSGSSGVNSGVPHFSLPHKLRHKHLLANDNTSNNSVNNAPVNSVRVLESSSQSDSGTTTGNDTPSPATSETGSDELQQRQVVRKCRSIRQRVKTYDLQTENFQLRSEMQRLASEVATLKDMLMKPKDLDYCHANNNNAHQEAQRQSPVTTQSV